jgi:hypothetical protein
VNKRISAISMVAMMVLALLHENVGAETVNTTAELQSSKKTYAYILSRPMLETMYRIGVEQDKKFGLKTDCKSQYQVKPFGSVVLSPIDFPEDKQNPTKGIWMSRYQLERCGESKIYNATFLANENGELPTVKAYYPGNTLAGPVLVKDALRSALPTTLVRAGLKDCKEVDMFDMQVSEKAHDVVEGGNVFKGVWSETWTFRACGQMLDVSVKFIPDATGGGTSFVTSAVKAGNASANP